MLLSFVNVSHIGYINLTHFSQSNFFYDIGFVHILAGLIGATESTLKCVTTLVERNVCVKILLHVRVGVWKAALRRNYFSRRNNFYRNDCPFFLSLSLFFAE